MAGYIRQDVTNNIADGNVINASDFDNEYNAIEAAFHATTGHTHDGTSAEGAPITKIGPTQDVVASASALTPKTDNTVDLGSSTLEYKDLYIDGTANIDSLVADTADINAGTIDGVTIGGASAGAATFTTVAATTGNITTVNATTVDTTNIEVTTLKAKDGTSAGSIADSTGVVTLASSVLTTTDINGGTIDGVTIGGAVRGAGSFTTLDSNGNTTLGDAVGDTVTVNGTTTFVNAAPTLTPLTASQAVFTNGSKTLVSNAITGSGNVVMSASPTLTGTVAGASLQLSSLTSGRVTYAGASGLLQDSANLTFNGTDLTVSGAVNAGTVNATTFDMTNLEVTNIKAKDGTAAASIADSTGIITVSTQLNVDNLNLSGNTLSSTNSNGDISLTPNGNGSVVITSAGTSNALRITQVGTGNALVVEDSANPDATPFTIDSNGTVYSGVTVGYTSSGITTPVVNVGVTTAGAGIGVSSWAGATSGAGNFQFMKSRGASPGTYTVVADGDSLGIIRFSGSDGTNFISAATIASAVDGTPGTNDMPGRLVFSTTADGASSPTERVRIRSDGGVAIGSAGGAANYTLITEKAITGGVSSYGIASQGQTQSDVTSSSAYFRTSGQTAAASFTLTNLYHYDTNQGTFGAGSAVTNQYGFIAQSNLIGATNNYGFFSNIASGTGRWNFYANGTAQNYFAGNTLIGTTTNTNSSALVVNGSISETVSSVQYLVASQYDVGTDPNEIPVNGNLGALAFMDSQFQQLAVGTGITDGTGTICKTSSGMEGGISVTRILIDLTGLNSGGTAGDIIGVNGTANPCYILALPSVTVLGGRMTCLEAPAGGDNDIDLYSATEGTGVEDQAITALTETQLINGGVQALGTVTYFAADPTFNGYLYLVGQGTANATYTAGRFLIEIFGVQP